MEASLNHLRDRLLGLSVTKKRTLVMALDAALIPLALWFAFFVRLGTEHLIDPRTYGWLFLSAVAITLPVFYHCGVYDSVVRFLGRGAVATVFRAVTLSALLLALVIYWMRSDLLIPRTLVVNYWVILGLLVGASRYLARAFLAPAGLEPTVPGSPAGLASGRRRVAIYGAGSAGYQLYRSLEHDPDIVPVAFVDDNPAMTGRRIGTLPVYGRDSFGAIIEKHRTRDVFLAVPAMDPVQRREILEELQGYRVRVQTIPSVQELTTGRKRLAEVQDVNVEDLLGRDVVAPAAGLLRKCVYRRTVMITGGGGSIGSELCRQIVELDPTRIILFDHSEFNLFEIEREIRADLERRKAGTELICILGSVLDKTHLDRVFRLFPVDTLYHAAAYKHVPIVEHNVASGVRNNVFGTLFTAEAALAAGVSDFVLVSTDKAVRPTNVMGASKRLAELVLQALASREPGTPRTTRFTIVRFGNVIGSSGSVIPTFREQIQQGGPVTVTHADVTRYFMTRSEAAQLVIQAGSLGTGGDVFVLDMGQPERVLDLAVKMIKLSGLTVRNRDNPRGDIEIEFVRAPPGRKAV